MAHTKIFGSWEADFAWMKDNCNKCSKSWKNRTGSIYHVDYNPCDLEDALLISFFGDGELPDEMKERLGYDGTVTFRCKEFDAITK